ncbi:unnamed protein product [Periconia digitata]|uniref:Zn(2)-C6 fungal-type domain-containing protein n=1 Tax=Periconia digitata TaxID=1303443 RepID=A0A9W4XW82_9PLEO|nr:unnamed protein product [Periconia digitata]
MQAGDVHTVLRCGQCNKPFDKPASLKRHGYYCRSRNGTSSTRARSCTSCASNKTRCGNERPSCSRCVAKGLVCQYPIKTTRSRQPKDRTRNGMLNNISQLPADVVITPSTVDDIDQVITLEDGCIVPGQELVPFDDASADWGGIDIDFSALDYLQEYGQPAHQSGLPTPLNLSELAPSFYDIGVTAQPAIAPPEWIPRPMASPRKLMFRQDLNKGKQRIADLLLRTLRSYPLMMLRHDKLPPFIHPQFQALGLEGVSLDSLTNCIGLVRMISGKVQGSRKLFWKNVTAECERIRAEIVNFDRWDILIGMQAVSVYLLVRICEGETDENNVDFLLLSTLALLTMQVQNIGWKCDTVYANCLYGGRIGWKDWVFEESRRRLSAMFRIVGMIVYLDPATMCDLQRDLIIAPLPSKKELWEASSQEAWRMEAQKEYGSPTVFGLAKDGELLEIKAGKTFCADHFSGYMGAGETGQERKVADWEEWCLGMDGFGGLIMLAASLVG